MPRGLKQKTKRTTPTPLDPNVVSSFHDLVDQGHIEDVRESLNSTHRLSNAKNISGLTPLMTLVLSESPGQTQVQIIDILMENGASLGTRAPNRCHVLLYACAKGAAPEVIDCLLKWDAKRGRVFKWSHCNSNKDGALALAAESGSLDLVKHLLSFDEMDIDSGSNDALKVLGKAIETGKQELVMYVIGHEKLRDSGFYEEENYGSYYEDNFSDEDDNFGSSSPSIEDCVRRAYKQKMYEAICAMETLENSIPMYIWLCWRDSLKLKESDPVSSSDYATRIQSISMAFQENMVYKENPSLMLLLLARSRSSNNSDPECRSSNLDDHPLLQVPDVIFKHIAKFCFTLDPDVLKKNAEENIYFQKNAEYCGDCEGWFLPYTCLCMTYGGYSS